MAVTGQAPNYKIVCSCVHLTSQKTGYRDNESQWALTCNTKHRNALMGREWFSLLRASKEK